MSAKTFLLLLSAVAVVLVTAAATLRSEVRALRYQQAQFRAYSYIHAQNVARLDDFEDAVTECQTWLEEN